MQPCSTGIRPQTHSRRRSLPWLGLAACALAAAGCEEEVRHVGNRPETRAPALTGVAVGLDDQPAGAAKSQFKKAPAQPEFIVGKRTQDIRNAKTELEKGGAHQATTKITAKDPITLQGNAYVTMIGRTSILQIQHALDLFHATNDRYPKDFDEFMNEIIKANNIALPKLPYYQAYGYDDKEHKLIILEYPH
ncbi:MAG TPA: hypothetical protein VFF52_28100 [Isosphaeraceae bacterium]|nr:hypothetical protein [Isosphaeraceae bacterium]